MKKFLSAAAISVLSFGLVAAAAAQTTVKSPTTTLAVIGDWPYNQLLIDNANLLIDSVNADSSVDLVMHLGDIHSGSMPCTSAGILPAVPTADPGFNQKIFGFFQKFKSPVVFTPGDNEWTDCHRTRTGKTSPLKELASIRELFFAKPGRTLGVNERIVFTQADKYDRAYPADAQFVENVIWWEADVLFTAVHMVGSNNDTLPWTNGFENPPAHEKEVVERTYAGVRWLNTAFQIAIQQNMKGVVIAIQADMWDSFAAAPGGDGLAGYSVFVHEIARLSRIFNKPVLLLNGDSHIFTVDKPLADPNSTTGKIHRTVAVPNLTRVTVQGATTAPAEWLKLKIDPATPDVFSWTRVPYCKDPATSCK